MSIFGSLFGGNSSKSTSSTTTTTNNVGAEGVEAPVTTIIGTGNNVSDLGAIAAAFDFARAAVNSQANLSLEQFKEYGGQVQALAAQAQADQGDKLTEVFKWAVGSIAAAWLARAVLGK